MDARLMRAAVLAGALFSLGASYRTPNFVVNAPTADAAKQIGDEAERLRRELSIEWTGQPMPAWAQPCPLTVELSPQLGAGGATSFYFDKGEVFGWQMNIQGPLDRVLDSVLPHEITHTVFACHFRRPLPRWADEGACSTVEHPEERAKQQRMLVQFLQSGRGIAFSQMFAMREYPRDVLPLYAQGHSLASFLLQHGDKQKFMIFVRDGMQGDRWTDVVRAHYGYRNLGHLQNAWLDWVRRGSPRIVPPEGDGATQLASAQTSENSGVVVRGQSADPAAGLTRPLVPLAPASTQQPRANPPSPTQQLAVLPGPAQDWAPTAGGNQPGWRPAQGAPTSSPQRDVIMQWNQAAVSPASAPPPAATPANNSQPPRSIYDARVPRDTLLR